MPKDKLSLMSKIVFYFSCFLMGSIMREAFNLFSFSATICVFALYLLGEARSK